MGGKRLIFGVAMLWAVWAHAELQSAWSRTYASAYNDGPGGLIRDAQGNLVVLVNSVSPDSAFSLIKYSPSGDALWTNTYDSPLQDAGGALAAAADGSVWVCANSAAGGAQAKLVVLKYSAEGAQVVLRTEDATNVLNLQSALAVDASGSAIVTAVTTEGYVTFKYSSAGALLWTTRHDIAAGYNASSKRLFVDTAGNAVVVGEVRNATNSHLLFLKYSPAGTSILNVTNAWDDSQNFLTDAAVDSGGNIFIAASVRQLAPWLRYHLFVAKYDSSGGLAWSRTRAPAEGYHAITHDLQLDSAGNVVVNGYERRPVDEDSDETQTLTLKYDPQGNELWSARSGFQRSPGHLVVDANNNIYVASLDEYLGGSVVLKYLPNGSEVAEAAFPGEYVWQIIRGTSGELYLTSRPGVTTRKIVDASPPDPLNVTISPAFAEVLPGSTITFTAQVSGEGPFTYDWRYFGYHHGGTNATFTITNAQFAWGTQGYFTVAVSNGTEFAISPEARLVVLQPPVIHIAASPLYVSAGQSVTLAPVVNGSEPFSYSWQLNGEQIPDATNRVLAISSVQATNAGSYVLTATNRAGAATSETVRVVLVLPSQVFTSTGSIQIRSNLTAMPYPSEINVSGVTGQVIKITATLAGLTSSCPYALDVLLEHVGGSAVMLMSGAADDSAATNVSLTFDDEAAGFLPDEYLTSGVYKPSGFGDFEETTVPPSPAPASWGTTMTELLSDNLNGTWRLYVVNQYPSNGGGQVANWQLTFLVADPAAMSSLQRAQVKRVSGNLVIQWDGAPGCKLQRTTSLTNPVWIDVPLTEGQSLYQVPVGSGNEFFRVVQQ